jgi:translation initiation factor IF-2
MRVYELSKKLNISNKELLQFLSERDFDAKTHMSHLSDEAVLAAEAAFSKNKNSGFSSLGTVAGDQSSALSVSSQAVVQGNVEQAKEQHSFSQKTEKGIAQSGKVDKKNISFELKPMRLDAFAEAAGVSSAELILHLLRQKIVCTKNQILGEDLLKALARHYEFVFDDTKKIVHGDSSSAIKKASSGERRLPVVVVVGHVDHGKTTLLDYIRNTRVAAREKGGITQHLGAYQVKTSHGGVVFLDTPGHEAFSNIRGRGMRVADIAILIVAADDGVMPQTVEAIKMAQSMEVPIVVAVNKVDKADMAQQERVKRDLAIYNLLPEEWGGRTTFVPISAKTGAGINELLETLALQADMMDLYADPSKQASGFVLESKFEKGRGPVATVICQNGTLRVGDCFSAGFSHGRVSSMIDTYGTSVKEAGPSVPVRVAGFNELSHAGDCFEVITLDKYKKIKDIPTFKLERERISGGNTGDIVQIVLKVDTASTLEAVEASLKKISTRSKKDLNILYSGVGDILESDVVLAVNTGALLLGLHVKIDSKASLLAQKNMITVHLYEIIYKLLEAIEDLANQEEVKLVKHKIGEAEVRKVFEIKNLGVVAGSYVKDGRFVREGTIVAWRGKEKIGEGNIKSLERDRRGVKEVHTGFEFAFFVDQVVDWQVGDRAECFILAPAKKSS